MPKIGEKKIKINPAFSVFTVPETGSVSPSAASG